MQAGKKEKIIEFLGLERSIVALLSMVILVMMGERLAKNFLPLYLIALGGGAFSVGLLNGMDNLLGALYSFPGGYLSDKLGYKKALLLFNLLAMFGYLIVVVSPSWHSVIVGSVFFISWTAISMPATMELVSSVLPKNKRTMGVSLHSLVRRIPMALGPVIGGVLIDKFGKTTGIRLSFVVAIILAVIALALQQKLIKEEKKEKNNNNNHYGLKLITPDLRRLLVSDILIRFCEQIPYAFAVVWCVNVNGISTTKFGILTAIEMTTAMLIYLPVAYMADKSEKKPFVFITFLFFTAFPLVLLFSKSFPMMILAFIIKGLKEFGEPTRKALIMDLAPEGRKAATFGLYYLIRDIIVSIAAFSGAIIWDATTYSKFVDFTGIGAGLLPFVEKYASPSTNFLTAFVFGLIGSVYFLAFGKEVKAGEKTDKE